MTSAESAPTASADNVAVGARVPRGLAAARRPSMERWFEDSISKGSELMLATRHYESSMMGLLEWGALNLSRWREVMH